MDVQCTLCTFKLASLLLSLAVKSQERITMADYHTTYVGPEGETTQWDDIQRKLGNLPAKDSAWKPPAFEPGETQELPSTREEDAPADRNEEEDDDFLERYRQQRISEMQQAAARPKFGSVDAIRGSEFVAQVTNAGPEVWVVVLLMKAGHSACELLLTALQDLARRYTTTKFLRMTATDCIPNYPGKSGTILILKFQSSLCVWITRAAVLCLSTTPTNIDILPTLSTKLFWVILRTKFLFA